MDSLGNPTIDTFRSSNFSLLADWCFPLTDWFPQGTRGKGGGNIRQGLFTFCDLNHWELTIQTVIAVCREKYKLRIAWHWAKYLAEVIISCFYRDFPLPFNTFRFRGWVWTLAPCWQIPMTSVHASRVTKFPRTKRAAFKCSKKHPISAEQVINRNMSTPKNRQRVSD